MPAAVVQRAGHELGGHLSSPPGAGGGEGGGEKVAASVLGNLVRPDDELIA